MNTLLLEKLGLTQGEVKVYLALNKLGESSIGSIGKGSKVSKSKIYDILDRLIEKGLVGYITKNGTKYFAANNPNMLLDYVEKKEHELGMTKKEVISDILPRLVRERNSSPGKRVAEIYEGFHGIKTIREELMTQFKPNDTLLVLGAPKIANLKWEGWFLDFHKKRIRRRINLKIIYNSDARKYGEIRKKMNLTYVRYLPDNLVSPNWIDIFPDKVLFVILLDNPLAFVVRDRALANSFKSYFSIMWKNSSS
ncbi:MAG TPA: helix-turn-helix domain-containing protein [Candidatus Nanoarchaeia archaeon]|nr:helix-turn-helix domain-containing protein [Candidatus Nanoarchaeia archaeon]